MSPLYVILSVYRIGYKFFIGNVHYRFVLVFSTHLGFLLFITVLVFSYNSSVRIAVLSGV